MNPNRKLSIEEAERLRQVVAENERLPIRPRFLQVLLVDEETKEIVAQKTIVYPRRGFAPDPRELQVELRTKTGAAIGEPRPPLKPPKYRKLKKEIAEEAGIHPSTLSHILADRTYAGFQ